LDHLLSLVTKEYPSVVHEYSIYGFAPNGDWITYVSFGVSFLRASESEFLLAFPSV